MHILIESAKNIILEGETVVDAIIEVSFMGKIKQTSVKKDVTSTTIVKFDEHIFINTGKIETKDIEEALIEVTVKNKGFFSSDVVGYFPISSTTIYNYENHVVHN